MGSTAESHTGLSKPKRKRVCLPRGLQISESRDLPLLKLIRDATYITRPQVHCLAAHAGLTEDAKNLNRRLRRLAENRLIAMTKPWAPFSGAVCAISHAGLLALENSGDGLESITSSSERVGTPNQIGHFLMLNKVRLALQGWRHYFRFKSWLTDRQVKAFNIVDRQFAKDYDGVAELFELRLKEDGGKLYEDENLTLAIEYEKTLKSYDSYDRITAALNRESRAQAVLYLTDSLVDARKIMAVIRTDRLPIAAVTAATFCSSDDPHKIRVYARASVEGPWYECSLCNFLWNHNYLPDLHTMKFLWKLHVTPGDFVAHSN